MTRLVKPVLNQARSNRAHCSIALIVTICLLCNYVWDANPVNSFLFWRENWTEMHFSDLRQRRNRRRRCWTVTETKPKLKCQTRKQAPSHRRLWWTKIRPELMKLTQTQSMLKNTLNHHHHVCALDSGIRGVFCLLMSILCFARFDSLQK